MALRDFVLVGPPVGGAYKCSPNLKAYRPWQGGSILILQLDRQSVSRPEWLANIYLIFLLRIGISIFLFFYVLPDVLAQTSSMSLDTIRIARETY